MVTWGGCPCRSSRPLLSNSLICDRGVWSRVYKGFNARCIFIHISYKRDAGVKGQHSSFFKLSRFLHGNSLDCKGDIAPDFIGGLIESSGARRGRIALMGFGEGESTLEFVLRAGDDGFANWVGVEVEVEVFGRAEIVAIRAMVKGVVAFLGQMLSSPACRVVVPRGWLRAFAAGTNLGKDGEDLSEEYPEAREDGHIDGHRCFAEIPIHVDIGHQRWHQAVNGTEDGSHNHKGTHTKDDAQHHLLLHRQSGFHDGRNSDRQNHDVGGDVEDGVDDLIVFICRALCCARLWSVGFRQSRGWEAVVLTVDGRDSPVLR